MKKFRKIFVFKNKKNKKRIKKLFFISFISYLLIATGNLFGYGPIEPKEIWYRFLMMFLIMVVVVPLIEKITKKDFITFKDDE